MRYVRLFTSLLIIFVYSSLGFAQGISCSQENREAVAQKIAEIQDFKGLSPGEKLTAIGKSFLGTPYVAKTLEGNGEEMLVVELQGLDCTTFVENVLAFALLLREEEPDFEAFTWVLQMIRYREGRLDGYGSRLHYFTEWITDNEKKGLVEDITASLGGETVQKDLNFMTGHRSLYPALENENSFAILRETEKAISEEPLCVVSVEMLSRNESLLASGDIIALATSIDGLDVTHTGFAIRMPDNRIHLLHASTSGAVEISARPLTDYLKGIRNNTGIIVARPVF